jgi:hypothetical protein
MAKLPLLQLPKACRHIRQGAQQAAEREMKQDKHRAAKQQRDNQEVLGFPPYFRDLVRSVADDDNGSYVAPLPYDLHLPPHVFDVHHGRKPSRNQIRLIRDRNWQERSASAIGGAYREDADVPQLAYPGRKLSDLWGALKLRLSNEFLNKLLGGRHGGRDLYF